VKSRVKWPTERCSTRLASIRVTEPSACAVRKSRSSWASRKSGRRWVRLIAKVGAQSCDDLRDSALCVEGIVSGAQGIVQSGDLVPQPRVCDLGPVDAPADQSRRNHGRVQIDDTLAEPRIGGCSTVVGHMRRKNRSRSSALHHCGDGPGRNGLRLRR
jgi:hypothetical protein